MPLVKNLRDHAVDVDLWELVGPTRVVELGATPVDPGCTIQVTDECAHGAPDALRAGLLDQADNWALADEIVGDGKGRALEPDTPADKVSRRRRRPRAAAGDPTVERDDQVETEPDAPSADEE